MNIPAQGSSSSWVGFCYHSPGMRHFVHFLPIDNGKSVATSLQTTIRLFASQAENDQVTFGGARIAQPDGIRLFDAFPLWYDEGKKLWGIEVTLSGERPNIELEDSSCIFEFSLGQRSVKFTGIPSLSKNEDASARPTVAVVQDLSLLPSIVVVNGGTVPFSPHFVWTDTKAPVLLEAIAPGAVKEIPLELAHGREPVAPVELSWGRVHMRLLEPVGELPPPGCAVFLVHRNAEMNGERGRIVSVVPLKEAM